MLCMTISISGVCGMCGLNDRNSFARFVFSMEFFFFSFSNSSVKSRWGKIWGICEIQQNTGTSLPIPGFRPLEYRVSQVSLRTQELFQLTPFQLTFLLMKWCVSGTCPSTRNKIAKRPTSLAHECIITWVVT